MIEDGLHVYIGAPGVAKTHIAIRHAIELAGQKSQGVLVIDSKGAQNLREVPLFRPGREFYESVFHYGKVSRVVPKDAAEFDSIIRVIDSIGNVVVLIDEVSPWKDNLTLQNLCRVWRHRGVTLFITTQKVGRDIEQTILACDPTLYLFRLTAPRSIEWVERWHKIPEADIRALPVGSYYKRTF